MVALSALTLGNRPALANTSPANAATPTQQREQLRQLEKELEGEKARQKALDSQAAAHEAELEALRSRLVTLADEERAAEEALAEIEASLAALEKAEREQSTALEEQRRHIANLLVALQRISRLPPEVTLANPDNPVDALRAALLLRDRVPALRAHAEALSNVLRQLTQTRNALESRRADAIAANISLVKRREEIAGLVTRREELSRQTDEERDSLRQEMAKLSDQAADLRQLVERAAAQAAKRQAAREAARAEAARIAAEKKAAAEKAEAARQATLERQAAEREKAAQAKAEREKAEQQRAEIQRAEREAKREQDERDQIARTSPPPPPAGGQALAVAGMRLPVGGRVTTRYGQTDRFGATSRGLTIRSRVGSPVVAPQAGTVVFAGPFRGYGQILIVEHSNGYHSLIAGLGRIDTAVGKKVASGEPMGLMPASGDPDLYFELRRRGQPINPQRGGSPQGRG